MKKILAIAFVGSLVFASCSKKEVSSESNRMLEEPEIIVSDTVKPSSAPDVTIVPAVKDSATTK